jgi:diguanylate cyclase (GGDEF)-like protein/PAS domain S-box-containing protein
VRPAPADPADRYLAERTLLELTFDEASIGLALRRFDGTALRVNRAMCVLTGRSPGELTQVTPEQLTHPDDVGIEDRLIAELEAGTRQGYEVEKRYVRPDGTAVWCHIYVSVLDRGQGAERLLLSQVSDITGRKAAEAKLTEMALHDGLTGLPNRLLLLDRVNHALARSMRRVSSVAVLFLDLDRFKVVNDSKGHAAGDVLLIAAAERLQRALRPNDTVARLGGDEFVVLCEDLNAPSEASAVARRLLRALSRPVDLDGREVVVTASIGIAIGQPGSSADTLLRQADTAMYQAKARGRNRAEVYAEGLEERAVHRLETEQDLRQAIERDQLVMWYQPQYSLPHQHLVGVEALVRWHHPTRGSILPADFLPIAEETGLIGDIGTFVLEAVCRAGRRWVDMVPGFRLAVNLSARQLETPGFCTFVESVLADHSIPADRLCFEVTESILMDIQGSTARQLGRLRALGVHLALDDFGTGYSSLSYLTSFPVDQVKIDRSFVADLGEGRRSMAVVSAVIGLAHDLGLEAVAEGAETTEQIELLRAMACDAVQGFVLGHPVPEEQIDALVSSASATRCAVPAP